MYILFIIYLLFTVHVDECKHCLDEAAENFNDVQEVARKLDPDQGGGAQNGIMALMNKVLKKSDEFIHVWRSCRGGQAPAMGLLYHLASTKAMTLIQLKNLVKSTVGALQGFGQTTDLNMFQKLQEFIDKLIEDGVAETIIIDDLEYHHFEHIAKMLSPTPHSANDAMQISWKNVAGQAGVSADFIDALDIPAHLDQQRRSLTNEFFRYYKAVDPDCPVGYIAQTLAGIGRTDVVSSSAMFKKCRDKGCIVIPERRTKKIIKETEEDRKEEVERVKKAIHDETDAVEDVELQ